MPTFVLDASLTLAWCFEDESTSFTSTVLRTLRDGSSCLVPPIWPSEVANGVRTAERRGRISVTDGELFFALLLELPIEVVPISSASIFQDVFPLALNHGLTVYDASYLVLAMQARLPLATLDDLLRAAAVRIGVSMR